MSSQTLIGKSYFENLIKIFQIRKHTVKLAYSKGMIEFGWKTGLFKVALN